MIERCVVAVDIGNSTVKLAFESEHPESSPSLVHHSVALSDADWTDDALRWVQHHLGGASVSWMIASVRGSAANQLVQRLSDSDTHQFHRVTREDVPMDVMVDHPDQLGIDRLLAAFAAFRIFGSPVVVVDMGSAITVDWVDDQHRFGGGAILPGLALQAESLHRWTEALPHLGDQLEQSFELPARNTADAIRAGILAGAAGAIDALADRYRIIAGDQPPCPIALTGGHAPLIAPHLSQNHRLLPNLVCRGLLDLPRSKQDTKN